MVGCCWAEPKMENNALQLLVKEKVPETGNYGVLGQILDTSQLLEQMSPRTCSWDGTSAAAAWTLADLRLGPQTEFCARKPPTSPRDLGSRLQVAYRLAPYACHAQFLSSSRLRRCGLGRKLPCGTKRAMSCCTVSLMVGFCVEGWELATGGLVLPDGWLEPDSSQRNLEGVASAPRGKQKVLVSGLCRSCRTPSIPELFLQEC